MLAMVLHRPGEPLRPVTVPTPTPGQGQLLVGVRACGVCRTDLHIADGELPEPKLPLVMGHEIVGEVVARGQGADRFRVGDRIGVPWLGWTCGECGFCRDGRENLCDRAHFTGYQIDGGYAEYAVVDQRFGLALPTSMADEAAAPLLCAGLIGYRALRAAGDPERLGIFGFGAAAHIVAQVSRLEGRRVFAFTRPHDVEAQAFARRLGAEWAGPSTAAAPEPLDAAIVFAPVGSLVPAALRALAKGGTVVCAGIHMSPIPSFPYEILWGERVIRSVANLTRRDGEEFLSMAERLPLDIAAEPLPLEQANEGLERLRSGQVRGAVVLVPPSRAAATQQGHGPPCDQALLIGGNGIGRQRRIVG